MAIEKRDGRSGQAFVELAVGMLVLALVMSALFSFARFITTSLDLQRSLRSQAGSKAMLASGPASSFSSASAGTTIIVEPFAGEYFFSSNEVDITESVYIPNMRDMEQ